MMRIEDDWIATIRGGVVKTGHCAVYDGSGFVARFTSREDAELFIWAKKARELKDEARMVHWAEMPGGESVMADDHAHIGIKDGVIYKDGVPFCASQPHPDHIVEGQK